MDIKEEKPVPIRHIESMFKDDEAIERLIDKIRKRDNPRKDSISLTSDDDFGLSDSSFSSDTTDQPSSISASNSAAGSRRRPSKNKNNKSSAKQKKAHQAGPSERSKDGHKRAKSHSITVNPLKANNKKDRRKSQKCAVMWARSYGYEGKDNRNALLGCKTTTWKTQKLGTEVVKIEILEKRIGSAFYLARSAVL